MKINYNKTMVRDYINGNDILEYELEQLENDASFMSEVVRLSKDKKMYDFASDEVKKDYTFVKAIIEMFKDDEEFIIKVANYYLENSELDDDDEKTSHDNNSIIRISDYSKQKTLTKEDVVVKSMARDELNVIMNNLIKNENKRTPFALCAMMNYETLMIEIAAYENEREKDASMPDVQLGFLYLKELYKGYPIVLDYLAKKMIDDLFYSGKSSFEEKIHTIVKNKEDINKVGINTYIISYINSYDTYLSSYVITRLADGNDLINELKKDITKVMNNWDAYEKYNYQRKIDIIWQEGLNEHDKYETNYEFNQFLDTVIIKLGLQKIYEKYSDCDFYDDPITEELTELGDISFMNYLEKLVSKEFGTKAIDKTPNDYNKKTSQVFGFKK